MILKSKSILIAALSIVLAASLLLASCGSETGPDLSAPNQSAAETNNRSGSENQLPENPETAEPVEDSDLELQLPRIGLYAGKGSWDVNVETLKHYFDAHDIEWSEFDEQDAVSLDLITYYDIIWFPGGFAAEYKNLIPDHSNIRAFVEAGGAFIGSCAGAYYAGDILRWHGTDHEYPLKLFDGKSVGPLAGQVAWGEIGTFYLEEDHPVNDGFGEVLEIYYFDGPYFEAYDSDSLQVLARYAVNNEPAVIAGRYGSGKYLLFGPHPELGGYTQDSPGFNFEGGEGARWDWLHASLLWFFNW